MSDVSVVETSAGIVQLSDAADSHPQDGLLEFIRTKEAQETANLNELQEAFDIAVKNKWRSTPLKNALRRARKKT